MDTFSEVFKLQGVAAILNGLGLAEDSLSTANDLNQGLIVLAEIISDCADSLQEKEMQEHGEI